MSNLSLRESQMQMANHLRDPEGAPGPEGIEERRLKIYRDLIYNNVEGFISGGFPVLRTLYDDTDWHAMVRSKGGCGDPEAMVQLMLFAERIGATDLVPVLERLAVRAIPEEFRGEDVAALLVKRPRSPAVLQAALQVARDKNNQLGIGLHLVALGTVQLERGEVAAATRAFREAEARYPRHEDALAWEKANLPRLLRASQALDRARKAARRSTKKPRGRRG